MVKTLNYQQIVERIIELENLELNGNTLTLEQTDELLDLLYLKRDIEERPEEE